MAGALSMVPSKSFCCWSIVSVLIGSACGLQGADTDPLFGAGGAAAGGGASGDYDTGSGTGGVATQIANNLDYTVRYTAPSISYLKWDGDRLSGNLDYRELRSDGTETCTATLKVSGTEDPDTCLRSGCVWGYQFTVSEAEATGDCVYGEDKVAYNLATPTTVGLLSYYTDHIDASGFHYDQLLSLAVKAEGVATEHYVYFDDGTSTPYMDGTVNLGERWLRTEEASVAFEHHPYYDGLCADFLREAGTSERPQETFTGYLPQSRTDTADLWQVAASAGQTIRAVVVPVHHADSITLDLIRGDGCLQTDGFFGVDMPNGSTVMGGSVQFTAPSDGVWTLAVVGERCASAERCEYALYVGVD